MSQPFRLAVVLRLRERERDQASLAVEEVRRAIAIVDERSSEIDRDYQSTEKFKMECLTGHVPVSRLLDAQRYQFILTGQLQHLAQQRAQLVEEQSKREVMLIAKQQEVKALEKLRDSQAEELRRKQLELQQSRLDEWSNNRVGRVAATEQQSVSHLSQTSQEPS